MNLDLVDGGDLLDYIMAKGKIRELRNKKLFRDISRAVIQTDLWNWNSLRAKIAEHDVYNSLLISLMPTASTTQILENNESIESFTSNISTRRVLSGEFQVILSNLKVLRIIVSFFQIGFHFYYNK